jgi:thioredoxin reductase (NADPH)
MAWSCGCRSSRPSFGAAVVVAAGGGSFQPKRAAIADMDASEGTWVVCAMRQREPPHDHGLVIVGGAMRFELGQIAQLNGEDGCLASVVVKTQDGEKEIPCTRLLPFFGPTMKLGPVAERRSQSA